MSPRLLLALLTVFAVAPGLARADIPELMACADKTDPTVRLACYDAAAAKLKKQIAEENTRRATLFGFQLPFTGSDDAEANATPQLGPKDIGQVDAKLTSSSRDPAGHVVINLDNGQSWRVNEATSTHIASVPGTPIQVVRNAFGGFYMNVNGRSTELSVARIK